MSTERRRHYYLNFFAIQHLTEMNQLVAIIQQKHGPKSEIMKAENSLLSLFRLVNKDLSLSELRELLEDQEAPFSQKEAEVFQQLKNMEFHELLVKFAIRLLGATNESRIVDFLVNFELSESPTEDIALLFSMVNNVSELDCQMALCLSKGSLERVFLCSSPA